MSTLDEFFDDPAQPVKVAEPRKPLTTFERHNGSYLGYATALALGKGIDVIVMCASVKDCVEVVRDLCPDLVVNEDLILPAALSARPGKGGPRGLV